MAAAAAALAFSAGPAAAQTDTSVIKGPPLDVYADGLGSLQVGFEGRSDFEFYGGLGGSGLALATDAGVSFPGDPARARGSGPIPADGGRSLVSVYTVLGLQVQERISYAEGTRDVQVHYDLTNVTDHPLSFRAAEFADLFLGGDDGGEGVSAPGFVGGLSPDRRASGLVEVRPWTHWEQGSLTEVEDAFYEGRLADRVQPVFDRDDAVAAEWGIADLAAGDSVPGGIDVTWRFEDEVHVNNLEDQDNGECVPADCTLREALRHAPDGSLVTLPPGTIKLDPERGELRAGGPLTVVGADTVIDAGGESRVLEVPEGSDLTLSRVRLTHGDGGAESSSGLGGAVAVDSGGVLRLEDSTVTGNTAATSGGGIYNAGNLTLLRSTLAGNAADGSEGDGGGALMNTGVATLVDSTLSGNAAPQGTGGAIATQGPLMLFSTTIAGNSAHAGGGIGRRGSQPIALENTIIDGNGPDGCSGPGSAESSHNLIQDTTCRLDGAGDMQDADAKLAALAANGGHTETLVPQDGSPAIDAGADDGCREALLAGFDQTGRDRIEGRHCDIGAVETFAAPVSGDPPVIEQPADGTHFASGETVIFSGTAPAGSAVLVYSPDLDTSRRTTAQDDGTWSLAWDGLDDGAYAFYAYDFAPGSDVPSDDSAGVRITLGQGAPPEPPQMGDPAVSGSTVTLHGTAQPGVSVTVLDSGTPVKTVTADDRGDWTAVLTDVPPGTHHYTAVASNGGTPSDPSPAHDAVVAQQAQATPAPTPAPTATPPPPPVVTPLPPPVEGQEVNAQTKSGTVKIKVPGSNAFVTLGPGQQVPVGTTIDTTSGRMTLSTDVNGRTQQADFYEGVFKVGQTRGAHPLTTLTLTGPKPTCPARASASKAKKKVKQRHLWGSGHGAFRSSGSYSAATVRGTTWLTQDTCAGTLTKVTQGVVAVRDNVKRKTVVVRAGHSYLARPKRR